MLSLALIPGELGRVWCTGYTVIQFQAERKDYWCERKNNWCGIWIIWMRIGMRVMFIFLYLLHIPIRRVRIGMRVIFAFLYSFRSPTNWPPSVPYGSASRLDHTVLWRPCTVSVQTHEGLYCTEVVLLTTLVPTLPERRVLGELLPKGSEHSFAMEARLYTYVSI